MAEETEEGGHSQPLPTSYEQFRNARVEENKKRMEELGLPNISQELSIHASVHRPKTSRATHEPRHVSSPAPARRSSRLQNGPPVSYAEIQPDWEDNTDSRPSRPPPRGNGPEIYTEEHEKLLGSCQTEWVLFQDGYGANGNRIYDSVNGKTCHQCRQKTPGLRTDCTKCRLVQRQFCGDCLYMRYGENIQEALQNPEWVCPVCRDICNCSICRLKKGWAPTGILYKNLKNLGYKSVAHYLILSRKSSINTETADPFFDDNYFREDPNIVSSNGAGSELGSDFQMNWDFNILHTNNSHGDISEPSKTAPDSLECTEKQCDSGDAEIISSAAIDDHSKNINERIPSTSEADERGGIAQRLRPRVPKKPSS